jgi:hypothetical protein
MIDSLEMGDLRIGHVKTDAIDGVSKAGASLSKEDKFANNLGVE